MPCRLPARSTCRRPPDAGRETAEARSRGPVGAPTPSSVTLTVAALLERLIPTVVLDAWAYLPTFAIASAIT